MKTTDIFRGWGLILTGRHPMLSIEITRECPLKCPGCYAFEPGHLGDIGPLKSVADFKGQELIDKVLALVKEYKPLHLSIVGGEPLVRFRELNVLLPELDKLGVEVQLVTSAVREIPKEWAKIPSLHIVVSIDGLQPDHDKRRAPATYDRILQNIVGHSIVVHCTITNQMNSRPNSYEEFLKFWSARPEVNKIWFSIFTPQIGDKNEEILSPETRAKVLDEIVTLRPKYSKLYLPDIVLDGYRNPPSSPKECIFSRTTLTLTADLKGKISPCQFGGNPDCTTCGCIASAGLNAIGKYKLLGVLPVVSIYNASDAVGRAYSSFKQRGKQKN